MSTPPQTREWNATDYHRISGPQVSWGKKVLARVHLRGDELLMDAGCGTGRLTAELLQSLPRGRVVGVDLSQNMLAGAQDYLSPILAASFCWWLPICKIFHSSECLMAFSARLPFTGFWTTTVSFVACSARSGPEDGYSDSAAVVRIWHGYAVELANLRPRRSMSGTFAVFANRGPSMMLRLLRQ